MGAIGVEWCRGTNKVAVVKVVVDSVTVFRPRGLAIRLRIIYKGPRAFNRVPRLSHRNGRAIRIIFRRIILLVVLLIADCGILPTGSLVVLVRAIVLRICLLRLACRRIRSLIVGTLVCSVLIMGPCLVIMLWGCPLLLFLCWGPSVVWLPVPDCWVVGRFGWLPVVGAGFPFLKFRCCRFFELMSVFPPDFDACCVLCCREPFVTGDYCLDWFGGLASDSDVRVG